MIFDPLPPLKRAPGKAFFVLIASLFLFLIFPIFLFQSSVSNSCWSWEAWAFYCANFYFLFFFSLFRLILFYFLFLFSPQLGRVAATMRDDISNARVKRKAAYAYDLLDDPRYV